MARTELIVKVVGEYSFETSFGYRTQTMTIYKMQDESGKVYVWKTSSALDMKVPGTKHNYYSYEQLPDGSYKYIALDSAEKGDLVRITATIKGESEYKGEKQTEIQRVKLQEIIERAEDEKAKKKADSEARKQEQLNSLKGEDFIWRMPYSQYKAHYSDCETVLDSYEEHVDKYGYVIHAPTIQVIIREGRLKASGVRGRHYAGYRIRFTLNGKEYVEPFRAVCTRTAINQAKREHPEATNFELDEIIQYTKTSDWY